MSSTLTDEDKTPILTPCPACRGERLKRASTGDIPVTTEGTYSMVTCRWCDGLGGLTQARLVQYCAAKGIKPAQ